MFALYVLGSVLEPAIGTPRFLGLYFASLLGGSFGALILEPDAFTVGASGAVFGLMAATFSSPVTAVSSSSLSRSGFFVVINLFFTFTSAASASAATSAAW